MARTRPHYPSDLPPRSSIGGVDSWMTSYRGEGDREDDIFEPTDQHRGPDRLQPQGFCGRGTR